MNLSSIAAVATLLLAGCGGGGGDGGADTGPQLTRAQLQGYWNGSVDGTTAVGGATQARAVVLEDGTAWIFLHDGATVGEPLIGLATATLNPAQQSFTGTGKRYPASGPAAADIMVSGNAPVGSAFLVTVTSGNAISRLALTSVPAYSVAADQASVVGTWNFTKAGGTINVTWNINSNGALTGASTLGCTYSGSVSPRNPTTAVYAADITETCTGVNKQLTGIARLNTDKTFLTFGLTSTGGAEAEAFVATKQ